MKKKELCKLMKKSKGALLLAVILLLMVRFQVKPRNVSGWVTYTQAPTIIIDGNDEFYWNSSGAISGGNGTEGNPYIIENWQIQINFVSGNSPAIEINNTDVHFIIRNCKVWDSLSFGSNTWGIKLTNVTNGRIENCLINPYNYYPFQVAHGGIMLQDCLNCTVVDSDCSYDVSFPFGYLHFGILLENTNYSTVGPNNSVAAMYDIALYNSHHNNIFNNHMWGKPNSIHYDKFGSYSWDGVCWNALELRESHNNLVYNNKIRYYNCWGIIGYLGSKYNTFIDNFDFEPDPLYHVHGSAFGSPYYEDAQPNHFSRINAPENKTYTGSASPAPGHYPSSVHFANYTDGVFPSDWIREPTGTIQIVANKTDAGGYDHKKVLYCNPAPDTQVVINKDLGSQADGTLEFWINKNTINGSSVWWQLQNDALQSLLDIGRTRTQSHIPITGHGQADLQCRMINGIGSLSISRKMGDTRAWDPISIASGCITRMVGESCGNP
ncbi:MAG: hypothetical protein ACFFCS_07715 [Candidatus Hodarchaeota archaeon]